MELLTKNQADWLIEKLSGYHEGDSENGDIHIKRRHFDNIIKEIINQCTEKEFPTYCCDNLSMHLDGAKDHIVLETDGSVTYLDFEEFKAFTKACHTICDWLKDQEHQ